MNDVQGQPNNNVGGWWLSLRSPRLVFAGASRAQPPATRRAGFSLMEVILAMTVLSITLGMLYSVAARGSRSGAKARDLTKAQLLCESKLAEISAGITPAMVVSGVVSEVDDNWLYSVEMEATDLEGIVAIRVSFVQNLPAKKRPIEFALVRWIRDPDTELSEETEAAEGAAGQ